MIATLFLVILGLCVGNLINMVAINILAGRPWFYFGLRCEKCDHELGFADQIPVFSFFLSGGRCKYCKQAMSWLSALIEIATAVMFVAFVNKWDPGWYLVGMLILGCTLLAVTATDLKTRLIPHDITYPSIVLGLLFSGFVRQDLKSALIGIGISYVMFDFLGHYGQKFYSMLSGVANDGTDVPEVEVLGAADAVLAATIASWLGWRDLVTALLVSFVVGIFMSIWFVLQRAYTQSKPSKVTQAGLFGSVIGAFTLVAPVMLMSNVIGTNALLIEIAACSGAIFGFICGAIVVGPREPLAFPFGPALAAGGFVAMFYHVNYTLPKWPF